MNWKHLIGSTIAKADKVILGSKSALVRNNYPYGRNVVFDLKRTQPEPKMIFDVGAFVGDMSLELHDNFPDAAIYAFEPISETFGKLKKNTANIPGINIFNFAVGEKNETITIPIYSEPTINTLREAEYTIAPIAHESINVIRLDNFMAERSIATIDILKVDVEGFELQVLNGLGDLLSKVKCIIIEVGYNTKTHFSDMETYMEAHGFALSNIYELMHLYNDRTRLDYSNNVYLNKSMV